MSSSPTASAAQDPDPQRPLPPLPPPKPKKRSSSRYKTFTVKQIQMQVEKRSRLVPEYEEFLMSAICSQDERGVTFDSEHPKWISLLDKVKLAEQEEAARIKEGGSPREDSKTEIGEIKSRHFAELLEEQERNLPPPSAGQSKLLEELRAELSRPNPDAFMVRQVCKACGVPRDLRGRVWQVLLGTWTPSCLRTTSPLPESQESASGDAELAPEHHLKSEQDGKSPDPETSEEEQGMRRQLDEVSFDLKNQRVIKADLDRTFPHLKEFRSQELKTQMEKILTLYCKAQEISYKQGMNYVLAPLMLIGIGDLYQVYRTYTAFVNLFLCNTFTDQEFGALQCLFLLFRFLLLYHDPEVCTFLDQNDMGPELYCSSWFITLQANKLQPPLLLHLWDLMLLEADRDPQFHFYFCLSLLLHNREAILTDNIVSLPQTLSRLTLTKLEEVTQLAQRAKRSLRTNTPLSFRAQLRAFSTHTISIDSQDYQRLSNVVCMSVAAEEVVNACYADVVPGNKSTTTSDPPMKYFVLDCRPREQYEAGYLPCAYHLDPSLDMVELEKQVQNLTAMQDYHFCFISEGDSGIASPNSTRAMMNLMFLRKHFKYVSNCEGGYRACHTLITMEQDERELIDHTPSCCLECLRRDRLLQESYNYAPAFMGGGLPGSKSRPALHRPHSSLGSRFRRRRKSDDFSGSSLPSEEKGGKKGFLKGWKSRLGRLSVLQQNNPLETAESSALAISEPETPRSTSAAHLGSVVRLGSKKTVGLLVRALEDSASKPQIFRAATERILGMLLSEALEQFQLLPLSSSAQPDMAIFPPMVILNWMPWARKPIDEAILPFVETLSIRSECVPVPKDDEPSEVKAAPEDDFDSDENLDTPLTFQHKLEKLFSELGDPKQHLFMLMTLKLDTALIRAVTILRRAGLSSQRIIILCVGERQKQLVSFSKRFPTIACILGSTMEEPIEEKCFTECFSNSS